MSGGGGKLNIDFVILILILCYHIIIKNHFSMSQTATANPTTPNKKQVRKEIGEKLEGALAGYKQELGDNKFATRVKEVSKLLSRDLEKMSKKHKRDSKKQAEKAAKVVKPSKKAQKAEKAK